jgi:glycosyltransferase involved in cell wall biosynthesis
MLITFVSAIRDEQGGIENFINNFHSKIAMSQYLKQDKKQLVLVEDGSSDKTIQKVINSNYIDDVLLIKLSSSRGQAQALEVGCHVVRHSDVIVMLDADLSHPFEEALMMIQNVLKGDDIAQGVRLDFHRNQFRNIAARSFGKYLELCFRIPYTSQNTYFRAISGKVLLRLTKRRPTFWSYLRLNSREIKRVRSSYVEFVAPKRLSDKSKYPFFRLVKFGLKGIVTTSRPSVISLNILFYLLIPIFLVGHATLAIPTVILTLIVGISVRYYQGKHREFPSRIVHFIHVGKNMSVDSNFEGNAV